MTTRRARRRAELLTRTQPARAYAYRILVAGGVVVTFYGLMTTQEVAVWLGLAAVVFNTTPAVATPTHPPEG